MPSVDTLDIAVNIIGTWEDELAELAGTLEAVDTIADRVDPIKIDVEVDDSDLAKLSVLESAPSSRRIDVGVDRSTGGPSPDVGGNMSPGMFALGPTAGTPSTAIPDGDGAATDGGSGRSFLDPDDIRRLGSEFGDALDIDRLVERGGETTSVQTVIEGEFTDFIDSRGLRRELLEGDLDFDVLEGFQGSSVDDLIGSMGKLQSRDLLDLPKARPSRVQRGIRSAPGFDLVEGFGAQEFNQLFARLTLLMSTFIGAIPAVVGGLIALGTAAVGAALALGAIGGLAALGASMGSDEGFSENLKSTAQELIQSFTDAFGPIAKQLAPLFDMAVDGLEQLFQDVADSGAVLLNFREEAIALGDALGDFLADTFVRLIAFADAASATFSSLSGSFDLNILGGLAALLARIADELGALIFLIIEGIPGLVRLSEGFLRASLALAALITGFFMLIEVLGPFGDALAFIIGAIAVYAGVLLLASSVTTLFADTAIAKAVTGFYSMVMGIAANITALFGYIGTVSTAIAATVAFTIAVVALYGILTLGVAPLIGAVSSKFNLLGNDIGFAADELERFSQQSDKLGAGSGMGLSSNRPSGGAYVDASSTQNNVTVNADNKEEANKMSKTYRYRQKQYDKELGS